MNGVMMLVNQFPPLPAGGAEQQAERLARYMADQKLHVRVITRAGGNLPAHETRDGFQIDRIAEIGPRKLGTITFTLGAMLNLWKRRREYDILHAHLAFAPAVAAAIMGRLLGKRVIVKFGNSGSFGDIQVSQQSMRGRLKLALLRRSVDVNIALDSVMEGELLDAGFPRERVIRMNNGIQHERFARRTAIDTAKAALGLADKTVLLYVGRLTAQKALTDLLQALLVARAQRPDLHLLLLGQGEERAALEQYAQTHGLSEHVTFAGNVAAVQPYLDAADIFVLSSLTEGISNALLEAMAAGLACVATSVGGTPEVLDQGSCGILVPPARPDLLGEALRHMAEHPAERARLGAAARTRIAQTYAFHVVGDHYIALYQRLIGRTPGRSSTDNGSVRI